MNVLGMFQGKLGQTKTNSHSNSLTNFKQPNLSEFKD